MPGITTVGHLIEQLKALDADADAPIVVATQPAWPVRYGLAGVARAADGTIYLVTNDEFRYLSPEVCSTLGW